jgi:hypothetical protein
MDAVSHRMQISGSPPAGATYEAAVAKKSIDSTRKQGQPTLQLIEASTMGSSQLPAGVGENVNIKA